MLLYSAVVVGMLSSAWDPDPLFQFEAVGVRPDTAVSRFNQVASADVGSPQCDAG